MSRFDELAEYAWKARKTAPDQSVRVADLIAQFLSGFAKYCGIPDGQITLVVQAGDRPLADVVRPADQLFSEVRWMQQALIHHKLHKKWVVWYYIDFTSPTEFVRHNFLGMITIKEGDSRYVLSFGKDESPSFFIADDTKMDEIFDSLYNHILETLNRWYRV